jgi:hypothetical protein
VSKIALRSNFVSNDRLAVRTVRPAAPRDIQQQSPCKSIARERPCVTIGKALHSRRFWHELMQ